MNGFLLTWLAFGLMLAVFAARAWVVETSRGRLVTSGSAQRGLTAAAVASVALVIVMLSLNGGVELVELVSGGRADVTQPAEPLPGQDPAVPIQPQAPAAPAPPAAPPG
ncbi:hypothetical protein [Pseudonocardia sp. ICBG1293]|uniref:hypothetical protein n=1 Tax=Pseudonocardia sp. ICBG1293 TaxID=2844382 RepID=UPI001CCDD07C|nr:hypothetical protein [Pseudonocardia sp. ICBG1293]